jgi:hypothetical protein
LKIAKPIIEIGCVKILKKELFKNKNVVFRALKKY